MNYGEPTLFNALRDGTLTFAYGVSPWLYLAAVVLGAVLIGLCYRRVTRPLSLPWRLWFITLRTATLALVLFCLLGPVVTSTQVAPRQTYLGVLLDSSQSMDIADLPDGQTRREAMAERFGAAGILDELAETYQVRVFEYDGATRRVSGDLSGGANGSGGGGVASRVAGADGADGAAGADGEASGERSPGSVSATVSALGQAIEQVSNQLSGLPLAALVLVGDGADNSAIDPLHAARESGRRGVPIYTVGVGPDDAVSDLAIVDVSAAKTVLEGSVFTVQAALRHHGFAGRRVALRILDGDTIVASAEISLGQDGATRRHELDITPERPERIVYELRAETLDGERIVENNSYRFLVDNTAKPPLDILYIEGHPRNEYKFIRRAVEGDPSLRLATYLQTGPGKFYRQGINSATELAAGFPDDRETLYAYEAILLGDIAKTFFSAEQLGMIEDFVAERGGGLLASGMVDEEFIGTPIADILPVTLVEEGFLPSHLRGGIRRGDHLTGELFVPRPTAAGEFSPLLRLAGEDAGQRARWRELPPLQGVFVTGRVKPGATVLLEHPTARYQNQALPVMVSQRFGKGRSMAVTTASTWRWQMMMPAADPSHEILWRQFLRWLASGAPDRVTVEFDREYYNVGDTVQVTARVLDGRYEPDNDSSLWLQVSSPDEQVTDAPMEWDLAEDGVYRSAFVAEREGLYHLQVDVASAAADSAVEATGQSAAVAVTPSLREFDNAALDRGLLGRIAEVSGGRYFDLAAVGALPDTLEYAPNPWADELRHDLWDEPWLLGLLIALLCLDWLSRRLRGLS